MISPVIFICLLPEFILSKLLLILQRNKKRCKKISRSLIGQRTKQIPMLSKRLYIPFLLLLVIALYLTIMVSSSYSWYIIPPILICAAIFFIQPELDWWWYQKHIPPMHPQLEAIIEKSIPFYAALRQEDKKRFQNRVELYVIANSFVAKGVEEDSDLPKEIKYFLATNVVQLTFGQADYRLPKFERMVIYPAYFPSPNFPEYIHASETNTEDGVLIFALDPLMRGIMQAQEYNIGFHEYAQAYIASYPDKDYAKEGEISWEDLSQISGMKSEAIKKHIALPEIDIRAVAIHHFFYFPEGMKNLRPALYERHSKIFNLDLLNAENPVMDRSKLGDI